MTLTERVAIAGAFPVEDSDQVMLVSDNGISIRCPVDDVRIVGRNTQGVTMFKTEENASVVSGPMVTMMMRMVKPVRTMMKGWTRKRKMDSLCV